MDDDDDEIMHLYICLSDTRSLTRSILQDLQVDYVSVKNGNISAPDQYLRSSRERFSTPNTARDPSKIDEIELENKDLREMIRQPMEVGAVWFHYEPESTVTPHAGVTATTFQGTTSVITARGQYQLEGTRWHLLTKVFSNMASYKADLQSEIFIQEVFDNNPKHRSYSWQVLRRAINIFGAKTYIRETSLTTPHFFLCSQRGQGNVRCARRNSHDCGLERAGLIGTGRHHPNPAIHGQSDYTDAPSEPRQDHNSPILRCRPKNSLHERKRQQVADQELTNLPPWSG